jgi:regulatory protein YycI of two-component signal transduction system YycFG
MRQRINLCEKMRKTFCLKEMIFLINLILSWDNIETFYIAANAKTNKKNQSKVEQVNDNEISIPAELNKQSTFSKRRTKAGYNQKVLFFP